MSQNLGTLLNIIIEQARLFLTDAGEFYPFGSVVKPDGTLTPVSAYVGNDHPASTEVLELLQGFLLQQLKQKEILVLAICLDVLYKPARSEVKIDALKVMTLTSEGHSRDYIVPYKNERGQYFFFQNCFGRRQSKDTVMKSSKEPLTTAVFTTKFVVQKKSPILFVYHDDDGDWQFHGPEDNVSEQDMMMVGLGQMIDIDNSSSHKHLRIRF